MLKNLRLSLSLKLLGLNALLLALLAIVTFVGLNAMGTLNDKTETLYTNSTVPMAQIGDVRANFMMTRVLALRYQYTAGPADRPAIRTQLAGIDEKVDASMTAIGATLIQPKGKAAFAALKKDLALYRS